MLPVVRSVLDMLPSLVQLQRRSGIPALSTASQFCHESYDPITRGVSELAAQHNNWAGIKWREWQRPYGCKPVVYGTWEEMEGQREDLDDAFCSCPDLPTWIRVYEDLLLSDTYAHALQYREDALLYSAAVSRIWATDSRYIVGIAGWMEQLYAPVREALQVPRVIVPVVNGKGVLLANGWLEEESTVVKLRELCDKLGYRLRWDATSRRAVLLRPTYGSKEVES